MPPWLLDAGSRLQWSQCSCLGGKSVEESVVVKQGKEREKCEIDQFQVKLKCYMMCFSFIVSIFSVIHRHLFFWPTQMLLGKASNQLRGAGPRGCGQYSWIWSSNVGADRCGRGKPGSVGKSVCFGSLWPRIVQDLFFFQIYEDVLFGMSCFCGKVWDPQPYMISNVPDSFLSFLSFARRSMMKLRCGCCISTWTHFHKRRRCRV